MTTYMQQRTLALLGVLLDFPELLHDPEVNEALAVLEGDVALAVASLRQSVQPDSKSIPVDLFLSLIPQSARPFATARLGSPQFELVSDARLELLENARRLGRTESEAAAEGALLKESFARARAELFGRSWGGSKRRESMPAARRYRLN